MSKTLKTNGLVIRETAFGESDKILTVLTPELGKISVFCKGVRSIKSHRIAATQLFCYDELTLILRGDKYTLGEACLIENFFDIRADISKFALAQYFADLLCEVSVENEDQSELLSLALNTFHILLSDKPLSLIKSVFELRVLCAIGLTPDLNACEGCGNIAPEYYLDTVGGTVKCRQCLFESGEVDPYASHSYIFIPSYVLRAMKYIIGANKKRIFAFSAEEALLGDLSSICEKYTLSQIGRGFDSLNFYKSL
jgi:DNA repair protein RecO (recombination protein O)